MEYSPGWKPGVSVEKENKTLKEWRKIAVSSTLTNLLVHIVFSTKGREPIISNEYRGRLYSYIGGIIRSEGAEPLCIGGVEDHVHVATKIKSNHALSDLVRKIKANSSKWINDNHLSRGRFAWQNGYGGFSVSTSQIEKVRIYIENQAEHHKKKTFKEELIEILEKHGVDFDPKYMWDWVGICRSFRACGLGAQGTPGSHPGL